MMNENAIEVKNVKKKFKVFYDKGNSIKEKVLFRNRNRYENRWVLKDISFNVKKGEAIGLIGHNGCGKSTTLKLLTRIMYPDEGTIEIKGRVSSLIELGAGFHPDMSGRENIYTNASIFGLTRREIEARMKDIIEFSELEEYLDNPVRTYSSGMYMRLAFSVAINVDADVLLIDEILAVGDVNFQAKCFNKLREIKGNGTTIVIVSHSLGQIEQICDRTIWLHDGFIKAEGTPRDIHPEYLDFMGKKRQDKSEVQKEKFIEKKEDKEDNKSVEDVKVNERMGNGKARVISAIAYDKEKIPKNAFKTGETVTLEFEYTAQEKLIDVIAGVAIYRNDGIHCYGTTTQIDHLNEIELNKSGKFQITIDKCNLLASIYTVDVAFASKNGEQIDYLKNALQLEFHSEIEDIGIARLEHTWHFSDLTEKNRTNEMIRIDNDKIKENILEDKVFLKNLKLAFSNLTTVWGDEERVHIGENTSLVNTLFNTSSGHIYIGEYTFTGHNVSIITGTHPIEKIGIERQRQFPTDGNDIIIGNGVWIGSNATILGPCTIGDNAVIAAGSVVLSNTLVPHNSVYAGVPAKLVKQI